MANSEMAAKLTAAMAADLFKEHRLITIIVMAVPALGPETLVMLEEAVVTLAEAPTATPPPKGSGHVGKLLESKKSIKTGQTDTLTDKLPKELAQVGNSSKKLYLTTEAIAGSWEKPLGRSARQTHLSFERRWNWACP